MIPLLLLLSCATESPDAATETGTPNDEPWSDEASAWLEPQSSPRLLRRMSLDLRGVLPSVEELDAVEADPGQLDALRANYLDDERFEARMVSMLNERWHTEIDEYLTFYNEYQPIAYNLENEYPYERSVGDEPLRLMARVAATDRPWTEIVTADYTVANEMLGLVWPIDYPEDGSGWEESHYTDSRPAAGVLATNGLWWRYYTTFYNYNRGRIAAISRLLLCVDMLSRPVSFGDAPALADAEAIEDELRTNPYCLACHSAIDPAASSLFGFWVVDTFGIFEVESYHPEREPMGEALLGTKPEWFGTPIAGLNELGHAIAEDPRFARCAAESTAEMLWRRDTTIDDFDRVEQLRLAYLDGGERMKPLIVAVTDTPQYQAGAISSGAPDGVAEAENTTRMLSPWQLAAAVDDLTGFTWTTDGFEQMLNDTYGYRVLSGGVDGAFVTSPQELPGATWAVVVQRLAEAGASYAVTHELVQGDAETDLLTHVDLETRPDDDAFERQLAELHWRLLAQRPSDDTLASLATLWQVVYDATLDEGVAEDAAAEAWAAVLTALLRDPAFVSG